MIAVVTGGGRGIGRAIARELATRGCDLALLGRTEATLVEASDEVTSLGRRALVVRCDIARGAEVAAAAQRILDWGTPEVVVGNAGVVHRVALTEMTEAQWDEVVDTNLKGLFLLTRALLPAMLVVQRGRFVNVASISATMGTPRLSAYCASKWGAVGFTKALAEELRGTGLQAMGVSPGSVDTDMLRGSGFAPAMGPTEVARTVAFLALDAPASMNGSCVEMFGA